MLLFTRREGQSLVLETSDGPIEVNLAYLHGEYARIGIDAPSSVGIVRKEAAPQVVMKKTRRTETGRGAGTTPAQ